MLEAISGCNDTHFCHYEAAERPKQSRNASAVPHPTPSRRFEVASLRSQRRQAPPRNEKNTAASQTSRLAMTNHAAAFLLCHCEAAEQPKQSRNAGAVLTQKGGAVARLLRRTIRSSQ